MIWACFLVELLKVVRGWSCLALAVSRVLCGMFHVGAACLLIDAAIVVSCVLMIALFAPLLTGLNALLGAPDGDTGRRIPTATWGRLKLGRLIVGSARSGDVTLSLSGACGGIRRHMKRP
jgi:hypothetical protein